ncbi:MAG: maleylpyruvate isomerase N-terminal domain-containing protein [Streptosporangiaceae bacterium]
MADRVPLSELYRGARERVSDLVFAHPEADDVPAPATPGWRVHDVVAHLTGAAEDLAGGWRPTGGPTDEWTAGHVARGKDVPIVELLEKWARLAPTVERLLDATPVWPVVVDAGTHEHDIRGALGNKEARDSDVVTVSATVLLKSLEVPQSLLVKTELREVPVGPRTGEDAPVTLTTTTFEAFRWRLGRRSRRQLAAMDWSGDPAPYLDHRLRSRIRGFSPGGVEDPETGHAVRTGDIIPEVTVDHDSGAIYLVWQDARFGPRSSVAFSQSLDGGQTWSAPIKVNATPTDIPEGNQQAFTPMVRVSSDGTIGVSYYDFRNNTAARTRSAPTRSSFTATRRPRRRAPTRTTGATRCG